MLHHKLQELEAELASAEQSRQSLESLTPECLSMLDYVEADIELKLAAKVPKDWKGWICYRRHNKSLLILRGRAFREGAFSSAYRAGFDVTQGADSITECQRGFDIAPPQELDHLLLNFGIDGDKPRVFLWYGQDIAAYKLIFSAALEDEPHHQVSDAIVEACIWIVKRPKHQTLQEFLETI
jgi:hypothetical protein